MSWTNIFLVVQLVFGVIVGLYFWHLLRNQRTQKVSIDRESKKELEQLRKMREISFNRAASRKGASYNLFRYCRARGRN